MTKTTFARALLIAATLGVVIGVRADTVRPSVDEVRDQIRIMEASITESSVTGLYSAQQRQANLDLLSRARAQADRGNTKTAVDLIEQAGRRLYPMAMQTEVALSDHQRQDWLRQIDQVMTTVLPAAREIAAQKRVPTDRLDHAAGQRQQALEAWRSGESVQAEALFVAAYNSLQSAVVALRSGDELVIPLRADGSREAWEEAKRRYIDWRYTADWMRFAAATMDVDAEAIDAGSRQADDVYREATNYANQQQWARAVAVIDQAYRIMEDHWRRAGIDI